MIWAIVIILVVSVFPFLVAPLIAKSAPAQKQMRETSAYIEQVRALDEKIKAEPQNRSALLAAKTNLERQLLQFSRDNSSAGLQAASAKNWPLALMVFMMLLLGTIGLYSQIGGYKYLSMGGAFNAPNAMQGQSLETLVVQLEQALKNEPDNVEGHLIYARSLMSLQRYDDALAAYDTVYEISEQDPRIGEERTRARVYVTAQSTAPKDRGAMIEGMVAALAAKLEANPKDATGWTRLIRSRLVLGQNEQAAVDVATVETVFADDAKTRDKILKESGWTDSKQPDTKQSDTK